MKKLLYFSIILLFSSGAVYSQKFKYIGAAKCKMCHNKPATGEQFKVWSAAPHANSLKSLSSPESLEYAKKNGIADPTKEASCLSCHSTYAAAPETLRASITQAEGVSCESCHGPGSAFKSASVMKDREFAMEKGMILATEEVCKNCHNDKNPFFKPFNFKEALAIIAHPNPKNAQ
ncbi:MAG: hypothetical protein KAR19_15885 [Bacteroidales bacterium]|nr:hypothetical protein [Bacteroidales bacterium]